MNSPWSPGKTISHLRKKNKACLFEMGGWIRSKALEHDISSCPSCDKNCPFSYLVREIANTLMHYLSDKKFRHSHFSCNWPDWLTGIIVNHGLYLSNKFGSSFLIRTIKVSLLYCRIFVNTIEFIQVFLILCTVFGFTFTHCNIVIWGFQPKGQVVLYAVSKFMVEWIAFWYWFPQRYWAH